KEESTLDVLDRVLVGCGDHRTADDPSRTSDPDSATRHRELRSHVVLGRKRERPGSDIVEALDDLEIVDVPLVDLSDVAERKRANLDGDVVDSHPNSNSLRG